MTASRSFQRRQRRRPSRGFTLIELMIALVMGVIVSLAAVALSRSATRTFFEEARISAVEANVRTASERFRKDLMRVSYMSTPNIQLDPKVADVPGATGPAPYRVQTLRYLQGIAIAPASSTIRTSALEIANTLAPQDVFVTGNLTSDDVYRGVWLSAGTSGGCGGSSGAQVRISAPADPAVRRLFNGATTAQDRQYATQLVFMPGLRMNPQVASLSYAVQLMDARGCYQYMTICGVEQSTEPDSVVLDLAGANGISILTTRDVGGDVCGSNTMEEVAVAPVQRVRWYIGPETVASRNDDVIDGPLATTKKFNLYRQLLDGNTTAPAVDANPAGANPVGPPEVIAEYAVDLKVGLVVNSSTPGIAATSNFDMDSTTIDTDVATWAAPGVNYAAFTGPQRVRTVRYRMTFRAALPDRTADLPMAAGPPYIARYNMTDGSWARARTVMSEVALMNQAKAIARDTCSTTTEKCP